MDSKNPKDGGNRFQILIELAEAVDAWRVFPRIFIGTYIYLLYRVVMWYMGLDDPTVEQSGMVSIISGVGAAWFNSYVASRSKSSKRHPEND